MKCIMCGKIIDAFTAPAWREEGLCSGKCWAELYGETDQEPFFDADEDKNLDEALYDEEEEEDDEEN